MPGQALLRIRRLLTFAVLLLAISAVPGQKQPEPSADELLAAARRAHDEKDPAAAAARYRDFLRRFDKHAEAPAAQYGLGQALRELGVAELARADTAPHRASGQRLLDDAALHFGAAAAGFAARAKPPAADGDLPAELEWSACCRCSRAEMQLRTAKARDARETLAPLLKEPLARSRYHALALYYRGVADFLLKDYVAAGRSLNALAPFSDPEWGGRARYLLARVHHLSDERNEAALHYEGVLGDLEEQKKSAAEALKQPEAIKDEQEKARLQALLDTPPPDHAVRAGLCLGVLLYEDGRFNEALPRFADVAEQQRLPALQTPARLGQGMCQVYLGQFAEAVQTLQPLAEKGPAAAEALLWLGKAQVGLANTAEEGEAAQKAWSEALATLRRAADQYHGRAATDPALKTRWGEVLLELADARQQAGQHAEAAAVYGQLLGERDLPRREEELLQRQVTALNLAGKYEESDQQATRFLKTYPRSTLAAEVHFRQAENAAFLAPNAKTPAECDHLYAEATRRYRIVAERFPDFPQANIARYGLAQDHYRKGEYDKARELLEMIPAPERTGELSLIPYQLADCLLRLAPATADDALAAGRLQEQLNGAIELLNGFLTDIPEPAQMPEALMRLGFCQRRLAEQLANGEEQNKLREAARASFERVLLDFPLHELQPHAAIERARCMMQAGDGNPAVANVRRFAAGPLKKTPVAPLALLQVATWLRGQDNRQAEAVRVLAQCRKDFEAALLKDPVRAAWVPLLQYHHAVALKDAGRSAEARALFDKLSKQYAERTEGLEAALRWGQCLAEEGWQKVDQANERLGAAEIQPEEAARVRKAREEGYQTVRAAIRHFEKEAEKLQGKESAAELRLRLLYQAVWGWRGLGDAEAAAVRDQMKEEQRQKLQDEAVKKTPEGQPVPMVAAPDVPLSKVELQPSEKKARAQYQLLFTTFPELSLTHDARLELGEWLVTRGEIEAAMKLFKEALDREPPAEVTDKLRLRLGVCYAGRGDLKAALAQFEAVAAKMGSALSGQGHYRAAECKLQLGEGEAAIEHLVLFRDQEAYQGIGNLSDRALLRLGHALGQQKKWDEARQAFEQLVEKFGDSGWVLEARYGIGWTLQKEKKYPEAIEAYSAAAADRMSETGARAQLQIGICLLEQKKYEEAVASFVAVTNYPHPELSALALIEAAWARVKLQQPDEAAKLLQQVVSDFAASPWAATAKERLQPSAAAAPAHEMPAAVRQLTPDLSQPLPLEPLGPMQSDWPSTDDPTGEASQAYLLSRAAPERQGPAPMLRQALPEPFEHRGDVRSLVPAEDQPLPLDCTPRPPSQP